MPTTCGANTATLTITGITAGMNGNIYRCRVNGTGASEKTSSQATLTVSLSPAAPVTSGATSCKGASVALTVGGSTDGNYRWYDSPTSQQAINGEVNSTFNTPVIFTATTTFYAGVAERKRILCQAPRTGGYSQPSQLHSPSLPKSISSNGTLLCGVNQITVSGPAGFPSISLVGRRIDKRHQCEFHRLVFIDR